MQKNRHLIFKSNYTAMCMKTFYLNSLFFSGILIHETSSLKIKHQKNLYIVLQNDRGRPRGKKRKS